MKDHHLPYLKWYPTDWRADPRLRMCSLAARGLWIELIGYMHEGEPYGFLTINGVPPSVEDIAALVGRPVAEIRKALKELSDRQVFSMSDDKIFSRRMVRDKAKAEKDRENGRGGGNPKIKSGVKVGVNPSDKAQIPEARSQIEYRIGDARASAFTEGSKALADAFWKAIGITHKLQIPPELAGADWRALEWERAGWTVDLIESEARRIGPGKPLTYHEKCFATAFAKLQAPLPVVEIREAEKLTVTHGTTQNRRGSSLLDAIDRRIAEAELAEKSNPALSEGAVLSIPNRSVR